MPKNVSGNSSKNSEKNDTILFVQKLYLRTDYIENNFEEDINMENHLENRNSRCLQKNSGAVCLSYVDSGLIDPSTIRNMAIADFNDEKFDNVRFVRVKSSPAVREHLTPKLYVEKVLSHSVIEPTLVRNNQELGFKKI